MIQALPFAILCGLTLAGIAASLIAVLCAQRLARAAEARQKAVQEYCEKALEGLRKEVDNCSRQVQEIRREPAAPGLAAPIRPGLNLSKRSRALRMHRQGDGPEQIAAALEIPFQEVDLLLKVHRMFIDAA